MISSGAISVLRQTGPKWRKYHLHSYLLIDSKARCQQWRAQLGGTHITRMGIRYKGRHIGTLSKQLVHLSTMSRCKINNAGRTG